MLFVYVARSEKKNLHSALTPKSLIPTTLNLSGLCIAALNTRRPILPNPLIPTVIDMFLFLMDDWDSGGQEEIQGVCRESGEIHTQFQKKNPGFIF